MIARIAPNGAMELFLSQEEARALGAAITEARPRGSAATPDGRIVVHVHDDLASEGAAHEPVEAR